MRKVLLVSMLACALAVATALAGTGNISDAVPNTTILASNFNKLTGALKVDFVPRNSSGVATSLSGSIGTTTYKWLKAHIESGYWSTGDIKMHYSYNGAISPGHGWMKMDGRQVTEANYDAEHGAGSWATYVGSSPLLNKYLPNMASKYPVGGTVTQTGSGTITSVGNASHNISITHTHTFSHYHQVFGRNGVSANSRTGNSSGIVTDITWGEKANGYSLVGASPSSGYTYNALEELFTFSQNTATTSNPSQSTFSAQPESIVVEYYMRIL